MGLECNGALERPVRGIHPAPQALHDLRAVDGVGERLTHELDPQCGMAARGKAEVKCSQPFVRWSRTVNPVFEEVRHDLRVAGIGEVDRPLPDALDDLGG